MRFTCAPVVPWESPIGSFRTKTHFLLFPRRIGDERRWLEKASWVEECVAHRVHCPDSGVYYDSWRWAPLKWVADPPRPWLYPDLPYTVCNCPKCR